METEKLRKAYFAGKLKSYVGDLMGQKKITADEISEINDELEKLKKEEIEAIEKLNLNSETTPPRLSELKTISVTDKWLEGRNSSIAKARQLISDAAKNAANNTSDKRRLMNDAQSMVALTLYLSEDATLKECQFKSEIIRIIDEFGVSRLEAQNRAECTQFYADWKNAVTLLEAANEFINAAKKQYGNENHY
jgi:hypothetical protein